MKFSHKVFFSTLLIIALIFGVGNTVLLNSVFRSALEREERVTLDENQMLLSSVQPMRRMVPSESASIMP